MTTMRPRVKARLAIVPLALGLSQRSAEATSLLAILPTVAAGAWSQQRYGNVRWRPAAVIGVTSIAGVVGGGVVAEALPEVTLRRLFAVLLLVVAAQITVRAVRRPVTPSENDRSKRSDPS